MTVRRDGGGLLNARQYAIIRVGRLGNERRWIESFNDKPHPDEHLPQAARNRVDRKQIEPQDFHHGPAKNDRIPDEAPDCQNPRNQLRLVERVAKDQTSYPKSDHGDVVGIKLRLHEHGAQGLKGGSIGCSYIHILAAYGYLNQYEENHDGNKEAVHDPEAEVADGYALAVVLLQDREHKDAVSSVPSGGHQPEHRGDCQQHAAGGKSGKMIRPTKNGPDEYEPRYAHNEPREVHCPHDSCGRPVRIRSFCPGRRARGCAWFRFVPLSFREHGGVSLLPPREGQRVVEEVADPGLEGEQVATLPLHVASAGHVTKSAYSCVRRMYVLYSTKETPNFGKLRACEVRLCPAPMGEKFSGSWSVTSRNPLIHNGATNATW